MGVQRRRIAAARWRGRARAADAIAGSRAGTRPRAGSPVAGSRRPALLVPARAAGALAGSARRRAPAPPTSSGPNAAIPFPLFPTDNPWNTPVDTLPVDPNSAAYLASIGLSTGLHADFGTDWDGAPNGIPYVCVLGHAEEGAGLVRLRRRKRPGSLPDPLDAPIEGGPSSDGDRHVLVLDVDHQVLYELYAAYPQSDGSWQAGSGAVFNLGSNALRPDGWTSADAAGLPILPGLVRYDEAVTNERHRHALRFTVARTQKAYIYPATHYASSSTDPNLPPMGLRVRLKADFDISGFSPEVRVILQALKTYGMMVADNGSNWYVSGAPDPRWSDDDLHELSQVKGSDFEVVDSRVSAARSDHRQRRRRGRAARGRTFARTGSFVDNGSGATQWTATVDYGCGQGVQPLALAGDHRSAWRTATRSPAPTWRR